MGLLPFAMMLNNWSSDCFCTSGERKSRSLSFLPRAVFPLPSGAWQAAHLALKVSCPSLPGAPFTARRLETETQSASNAIHARQANNLFVLLIKNFICVVLPCPDPRSWACARDPEPVILPLAPSFMAPRSRAKLSFPPVLLLQLLPGVRSTVTTQLDRQQHGQKDHQDEEACRPQEHRRLTLNG